MTPLVLCLAIATSSTSTASAWRTESLAWEDRSEVQLSRIEVCGAELGAERIRSRAAVARADLAVAKGAERIAGLEVALADAEAKATERVSRASRGWGVAGAVALGLGAAAALVGVVTCDSSACREALGLGGLAVAAAGGAVLGVTW